MPTKVKKLVEISQIVPWKQLMKRWRSLSLSSLLPLSGSKSGPVRSGSNSGSVRSGHLAVYVGPGRRRFVIPTRFLNFPVFTSLLEEAEKEFGFQQAGGLVLPCDVVFFCWVIDALERDEEGFKEVGLDGFLKIFYELGLIKA